MMIEQRRVVESNPGIELTWYATDFITHLKSWRSQPDGARQRKQKEAIEKTKKRFTSAIFKSLRYDRIDYSPRGRMDVPINIHGEN